MGTQVIVCAFYTMDTPYEEEAKRLKASLGDRLHHIEAVLNRGEWVFNCAYKPTFILKMLRQYEGYNILYVDADARITGDIDYFTDLICDISVRKRKAEILSGTIFIQNTPKMITFIRQWQAAQHKQEGVWDQKILAGLLKGCPLNVEDLPKRYCKIIDEVGEASITHTQASRRLRNIVRINDDIPPTINGVRIRRYADGSFGIARGDRYIEGLFDSKHVRLKNQLRWHRRPIDGILIKELAPFFKGKCVHVIGKGPSLDALKLIGLDGPVVAINDAIHKVEELDPPAPTFTIQQDETLGRKSLPKRSTLIVSRQAALHYNDFANKAIYAPEDYSETPGSITVVCLIKIALSLGAKKFKLYCFDACVNENVAYAKCIGYEPGIVSKAGPERFLKHRHYIIRTGAELEWVIPTLTTPDTPEQLIERLQEHGAPVEEDESKWLVPQA